MSDSPVCKTCLHLVVSASRDAVDDCVRQAVHGDQVVMMDAGVMHLVTGGPAMPDDPVRTAWSAADLDARGLLELAHERGVHILDDREIAALLPAHDHCLTWK